MRAFVGLIPAMALWACASVTETGPDTYVVDGASIIAGKAMDTCEDQGKDITITRYETYKVTFRCD